MTLYDDDVLGKEDLGGLEKAVQSQGLARFIGGPAWRFGLCCFAKGARGAGQEGLHCGRSYGGMVGKSQDYLRLLCIVRIDRRSMSGASDFVLESASNGSSCLQSMSCIYIPLPLDNNRCSFTWMSHYLMCFMCFIDSLTCTANYISRERNDNIFAQRRK